MSTPALTWDAHGVPHSVFFNDKYFCKENGYEDTMSVSCNGNRLQERFSRLDPAAPATFIVIESGFGTGLTFCCTWQLWRQHAPAAWTLHFISLDKYPMGTAELNKALLLWPVVDEQRRALISQYSPAPGGISSLDFDKGRVRLTLVFDDVVRALKTIADRGFAPAGADALFFDGFAPSKNPDMWTEQVFAGMARLSNAQTTFATFTVAGWVRRGLQAQGFRIRKEKGYGLKKHMLVGTYYVKNSCS